MTQCDYDDFYETVIQPCIKKIEEYAQTNSLDAAIRIKQHVQNKIFKHYQFQRDFIVSNYMQKNPKVALDRHKVASCMVYAILKTNPIKINRRIRNLPEQILLANEYLAFFVALNIVEMYKLDELEYSREYQIMVPKTYYEDRNPNNTYESNLCKAWSYIKLDNMSKFDVLAYAHIFFLLEKYTDIYQLMEQKR